MKSFRCELCDGNEVIKEGDFFVCQSCGTKYTLEAARKLMFDVDDNDNDNVRLNNLYQRARKSLEVNDLTHAAEYYKQILDEKPNDWEAYFYSYLGEFDTFTNSQAASVALKLGDTIPASCDMVIENCEPAEAEKHIKVISEQSSARISRIAATAYSLLNQYESGGYGPAGHVNRDLYKKLRPVAVNTVVACVTALGKIDEKIDEIFKGETPLNKSALVNSMLIIRQTRLNIADHTFHPSFGASEKLIKQEVIQKYTQDISDLNSYLINEFYKNHSGKANFLDSSHVQIGRFNNIPLIWTVISVSGNSMKMACDTCVIQGMVHPEKNNIAFKDTALNKWLNSEFLNYAFLPNELEIIKAPEGEEAVSIPSNPEVINSTMPRSACMHGTQTIVWWWTKSQVLNISGGSLYDYDQNGRLNTKGHPVTDQRIGVRPTLWLTLD